MNARRESNHDGDDTNGSAFSSTSSYSILPSSRQLKTPTLNENNNNNNKNDEKQHRSSSSPGSKR